MFRARHMLAACLFVILIHTSSAAPAAPIRMGFVGGRSPEGIVREWSPLLDYLSRKVGVPFEMILKEDYAALVESLKRGEIDLFEGGAFSHVTAVDSGVGEFLMGQTRRGTDTYKSVFIVRADSDIASLADAKGKTLALTDELSTSGYLVPRVMLKRRGITNLDEYFEQIALTGSHDRSIEAILEGAVDMAAVADFFIAFLKPEERAKLRIIEKSDPVPLGPITVRKDYDPQMRERITSALLDFHKNVTKDIMRIVEVDRFIADGSWDYDAVKAFRKEAAVLPKLGYAVPYKRIPTVLAERISHEKKLAFEWMIGAFIIVAILLLISFFVLKRRISTTVGIVVTAIVAVLAAVYTLVHMLTLFSSINTFAAKKLGEMENLNLRTVAAIGGAASESLDHILNVATQDDAVTWAKVFRNGFVIASNNPNEVGVSIIDQIRTNTFDKSDRDTIQVLDPIVVNGRRYATAQIGLSFKPLNEMTEKAIIINTIAMAIALAAGIFVAIVIRLKLGRPVNEISRAVDRLREGESVEIENPDADLNKVTKSISKLGKELEEKQKLIDLQTVEHVTEQDPEVTKLLAERFREMEIDNPSFRKLRATEAVGSSPAWLRCILDAAIRGRDREPAVILGASGSGKTSVARVIHALSTRANQPMGEFNCAEFQSGDPLAVLGKLFGYGANSGIQGIYRKGQKGILEEFDGGTLFFDEVGIMPMQAQQLLLLPLEGRAFNPVAGKGEAKRVDVRFIFATNEPLEALAHAGKVRHDLLRRIQSRGIVNVPPLSHRKEDIELLARNFLARRNSQENRTISFSLEAVSLLARHGYDRYNVSELMGDVNHAYDSALFEHASSIEPRHLSKRTLDALGINPEQAIGAGLHPFDKEEQKELVALRRENFNITRAESKLGFANGSKTLTNHFRGIVYSSLERNGWDIERTVSEIGGPDVEERIVAKIGNKSKDYIANAHRHLESGTISKLFNNLPLKYHAVVERLLEAIRNEEI